MSADAKQLFSSEGLKSLWLNSVAVRILVVILAFLPVFLVAYTILYRLPLIGEVTEKINLAQPLAVALAKSRMVYSPGDADAIKDDYDKAIATIPKNRYELKLFLDKFKKLARSKGFDTSYTVGTLKPAESNLAGISSISVQATFTPKKVSRTGLLHFLRLIRGSIQKFSGLQINGITVQGNGIALSSVNADFVVWVGYSK